MLSVSDFETVLGRLPSDIQIHFSGFSEPFLNPNCGEMIDIASKWGFEVHLYTTLVGLSQSHLEHCSWTIPRVTRIHVPDGKFLKIANEPWLKQFELLLSWSIPFTAMAMGPVDPVISKAIERCGLKVELPDMLSRGGNLWNPNLSKKKFSHCSMNRWHNNVMLPNGDVVGDCHDYGLTIPLGNLLKQPYQDIYDAAEVWKNSNHDSDICSRCEWAVYK